MAKCHGLGNTEKRKVIWAYGSKWVGVRYSGAEEWWLELEAKCLHGSEVGGRENELAMPRV